MKNFRLKYLIFLSFSLIIFCAKSQNDNSEASVTIEGNAVIVENNGNSIPNNYQTNIPPPPAQQQFAPTNQNIEPTMENGFHMRFQVESPGSVERISSIGASSSFSSSGSGGAKAKKHSISLTQRSFNFKKKLKNWLPERKKKYRPSLCEKFR